MTRNASGNAFQLTSRLQDLLANIVVDFDADDDENEKEKEEEEETEEGGEGGQSGSSGTGNVKDPDKKRLSDEAAKYRKERNSAKKELEEAQKRLREIDDASKSELEKAQRDLSEAQAKLNTIESRTDEQARRLAFYESGASGMFRDPRHALKLIDLGGLELNEDGEFDAAEVKKRAEALLKESPYLGANSDAGDESGGGEKKTGGEPKNNRRKKEGDSSSVLRQKFPALASRG